MTIGFGNQTTAPLGDLDNLLASTVGLELRPVVIAVAVQDTDSPNGATFLRRGLILTKHTSSGDYVAFATGGSGGAEIEANAVILAENVQMDGTNKAQASAIFKGTVYSDAVYVSGSTLSTLTQADVQRLSFVTR